MQTELTITTFRAKAFMLMFRVVEFTAEQRQWPYDALNLTAHQHLPSLMVMRLQSLPRILFSSRVSDMLLYSLSSITANFSMFL